MIHMISPEPATGSSLQTHGDSGEKKHRAKSNVCSVLLILIYAKRSSRCSLIKQDPCTNKVTN